MMVAGGLRMLAAEQRRRIELFVTRSDLSSEEPTAAEGVDWPDMTAAEVAGIDPAVGSAGGIRYTGVVGVELESFAGAVQKPDNLYIAVVKELSRSL